MLQKDGQSVRAPKSCISLPILLWKARRSIGRWDATKRRNTIKSALKKNPVIANWRFRFEEIFHTVGTYAYVIASLWADYSKREGRPRTAFAILGLSLFAVNFNCLMGKFRSSFAAGMVRRDRGTGYSCGGRWRRESPCRRSSVAGHFPVGEPGNDGA